MSEKPEYSLSRESDGEDVLDGRRQPFCLLCQAEHESCLDDEEIAVFDDLGWWDEDDDEFEDDWEDDYDG